MALTILTFSPFINAEAPSYFKTFWVVSTIPLYLTFWKSLIILIFKTSNGVPTTQPIAPATPPLTNL